MLSMRTLGLFRGGISKRMNCFKDGKETTKDDRHAGRPETVTNDRILKPKVSNRAQFGSILLISKSAGKVMAIIFCNIQVMILYHFVPLKTLLQEL